MAKHSGKRTTIKGPLLLLITALVWGCAFVAQSESGKYVGAYTFNAVRSLIGAVVLVPVFLGRDAARRMRGERGPGKAQRKLWWLGGTVCGALLCLASNLQQLGINAGTGAGKAGFITALYILLVPILGLFVGRRVPWRLWLCIAAALFGLYLLCLPKGGTTVEKGDLLVLGCAGVFSLHILAADYFSPRTDGVRLSAVQFLVCGVLSAVGAVCTGETVTLSALFAAYQPILYAGVMSCGVAYTLQIVGQKYTSPTLAALIMSLESVFAVLAGAVLLGQIPTLREGLGSGLMFAAILLAQLPGRGRKTA